MKPRSFFPVLAALLLHVAAFSQNEAPSDSTGLPGDHFSLEGAIELFRQSESPEDFEKRLNAEDNHVNNLDLNEDGETDYIRVVGHMEGDAHVLVLQAPLGADEAQDIATLEIEKQGENSAVLQILGNEDVFGEQVIAEPFEAEDLKKGKNRGPSPDIAPIRVVVNVWLWPSVRFMYAPGYRVWVSPWRWAYYPAWWRPWRPHPFFRFRTWARPYHARCHVVGTHRVVRAHAVYVPRRVHSTTVRTRTTTVVNTRRDHGTVVGHKRTTTTTTRQNGRVQETKTTQTKVTRNPNGRAKAERGQPKAGKGGRKRGRN
jgi:hypothetical protein